MSARSRSWISQLDGGFYPWKQTPWITNHGSCLLSERKSNRIGHVRLFPYGVSPASCSTVPKLFVGLVFHQLHLCPPRSKWDVCKQNSGLLPGFRVLINPPSQGETVTCITQWPWGHSRPLGLMSTEGLFIFLGFPQH